MAEAYNSTGAGKRGFTLIELLVVVAVIAILASLLLPGIGQAKAAAQSAKCKSNLRQLAAGLQMYVDANEGQYPVENDINYWRFDPSGAYQWEGLLAPYVMSGEWTPKKDHILNCPTRGRKGQTISIFVIAGNVGPSLLLPSYGYNAHGSATSPQPSRSQPQGLGGILNPETDERFPRPRATREADVRNPANLLTFGDGYHAYATREPLFIQTDTLGRGGALSGALSTAAVDLSEVGRRHRKRLNMSFADGHVENGTIHKWYLSMNEEDLRRWNASHEP